jgi:4-hydroxy 2-oxovalerate aldolase
MARGQNCEQIGEGVTLDVTLRDGGYVNGHSWSLGDAADVVAACIDGHVPYCEAGYYRPERP